MKIIYNKNLYFTTIIVKEVVVLIVKAIIALLNKIRKCVLNHSTYYNSKGIFRIILHILKIA